MALFPLKSGFLKNRRVLAIDKPSLSQRRKNHVGMNLPARFVLWLGSHNSKKTIRINIQMQNTTPPWRHYNSWMSGLPGGHSVGLRRLSASLEKGPKARWQSGNPEMVSETLCDVWLLPQIGFIPFWRHISPWMYAKVCLKKTVLEIHECENMES